MNQHFPTITRPANSRTGKLQFIDQSNAIQARPRTVKATRHERFVRLFWAIAISLSVGYLAHGIFTGLPLVLTQHRVL